MKRYLLSAFMAIVCCVGCMAQDALVIEWHNGLADIFTVTPNLHIDNGTENDSVFVMEADSLLASYARADIKRIAFDDEVVLTDSVERAALVALYKATDGDNWTNKYNWCTNIPLYQWYGVENYDNNHVKKLNITANNLMGSIPIELFNLKDLTSLSFFNNKLSGEIPAELGRLIKLSSLTLGYNQLTGELPAELKSLTNLTELNLYGNQLTGEIPSFLKNFKNLKILTLAYNQFTGRIPSELGNLTHLTNLILCGNQLTGEIPSELGNLINLEYLALEDNQLTGEIPKEIGNLTKLEDITLYFNQLTGEIPAEIGNLTKLTRLCFYCNQLSGNIPPEIGNLINLTEIDLQQNQLTGIPATIGNLKNLTYLNLDANRLLGEIPAGLGNLTNLTELHLSSNKLSGVIPSELCNLPNLTELDLSSNLLTKIPADIGNLQKLTRLFLSDNYFTSGIPSEMGRLANLECLVIDMGELTGRIPPELGELSNLSTLVLARNHLTGEIPSELGKLANLVNLDLYWNQLTGDIPDSFNNLKGLISSRGDSISYIYMQTWHNNLSGKVPSMFTENPAWVHEWWNVLANNRSCNLERDVYVPAPSFHVTDIDGNILDSKEIYPKNKYTAIFHWATWCGYSNALMAELIPLYEKYKDVGFEIVGLSVQGEESSEEVVREFITQKEIKWRNFISKEGNMLNYPASCLSEGWGYPGGGTPEITLVDSTGRVIFSDWINERSELISFLEDRLGQGAQVDIYASTDYSSDGLVKTLQSASTEKDIKVVVMGDGFSDRLVADGTYDAAMKRAMEALFTTEPMKSYRERFTVKSVTAVSRNERFSRDTQTALQCFINDSQGIGGNVSNVFQYAQKAISAEDMDDAIIIVVLNSELAVGSNEAGICHMYQPEKENSWGSGASVSFVPNMTGNGGVFDVTSFETVLSHEAIGHGFAKLGDEYIIYDEAVWEGIKEYYRAGTNIGWWKNVDFTSNPEEVKWSTFITDDRYKSEGIGVYEGALTYESGAYRPTQKSIMTSKGAEFNAPSRMAIWYRINKLTQGEEWEGTYEDFVAFDLATRTDEVKSRAAQVKEQMPTNRPTYRGAPPVVMDRTWRSALKTPSGK